jgi:hypothetical protein
MKQVVISSTLLDFEDAVVKLHIREVDDSGTLVKFALRYAENELGHGNPSIGHSGDTDDENEGKVVTGDTGVYFFFDNWVHKFEFLNDIERG